MRTTARPGTCAWSWPSRSPGARLRPVPKKFPPTPAAVPPSCGRCANFELFQDAAAMKNSTRAFANQLLVCLLVTICFGGTAAVGLVWLRHQISITANNNRALAARLREIERQVAETTTIVESAQSPD